MRFYQGQLGLKNDVSFPTTISSTWLLGFIWSPLLHTINIFLVGLFLSAWPQPDLNQVLYLVSGNYGNDEAFRSAISSIADYPLNILGYFLTIFSIAALMGIIGHFLVREFRLDHKSQLLRFPNHWNYLFSGELDGILGEPETIIVSTTVSFPDVSYIYSGFLSKYHIDQSGDLLRLEFAHMWRRKIIDDRSEGEEQQHLIEAIGDRWYEIPGDVFILWCKDIHTLNIRYVYSRPNDSEAENA